MALVLKVAHRHSTYHLAELQASDKCGCYHCLEVFPIQRIAKWTDGGKTALCPYCGIDAIIGSAAGFPLTPTFLRKMRRYWFRVRRRPPWPAFVLHALRGPWHLIEWLRYGALLARVDVDIAYHRQAVLASDACGCYRCMSIFPPGDITKWFDQDAGGVGQTAVCPRCGECGVLGSADGFPITTEFLGDVRKLWS